MDDKLAKRLEIIKSAEKIGISKTAELFSINRKTVSKWLKRYQEGGDASLGNKSKKHQNQPDKMPFDIENRIIELKKGNSKLSANKIKQILNLSYSVTAINKKIREAGLNRKTEVVEEVYEGIPLTEFYVFIKKNSLDDQPESSLPRYQIVVEGKATGIEFIGYSHERSSIAIAVFVDYIVSKLIKCGLKRTLFKFYFNDLSAYSNRKSPIKMIIGEKFHYPYEQVDKDRLKSIRATSFSIKRASSFVDLKISSEDQLLVESYAYLLHFNYQRHTTSQDKLDGDIPKKILKNLIKQIPPILIDKYITRFRNIVEDRNFWDKHSSNTLLDNAVEHLAKIGENAVKVNENRKAIEFYHQILVILSHLDNTEFIIMVYHKLGTIFQKLGERKEAIKSFSDGLKLAEKIGHKKYIMTLNSNLAVQHYMSANYKTSIEFAKKSAKQAEGLKDIEEIANSYQILGVVNEALGNYTQSLKYYKNVIDSCKGSDLTLPKVKALGNIGVIYFKKMQLKKALVYHKEAYELCQSLVNSSQMVRLLNNIGCIYDEMGELDNAMFNYKQLLSFSTKTGNVNGVITATSNIGNIYLTRGEFSDALINFNTMLEKSQQIGNKQLSSVAYANIADIYKQIDKHKNSMEYYDKAIKISSSIDDKYYLCSFIYEKAELQFQLGEYDSALRLAKKSFKIAGEIERGDIIFESWLLIKSVQFFKFKSSKKVSKQQDDIAKELFAKSFSENDKERLANIYYTIYTLLKDESAHSLGEEYDLDRLKKQSLRRYKTLYEKVPKFIYKKRIEKLLEDK